MERNYRRKHAVHRTNKDYWRDQNERVIQEELEMACKDFENLYNSNCSVERETKGEDMYSTEHANLSLTTLLSELEDNNDNNELLRVIANELGLDDLEEKIVHMKAVHRSIGNMPHHLYMERNKYRKEIKERGVNHPNWNVVKDFV